MSEWVSVLAVFWALWALDGVRLARRRAFTFVGRASVRKRKTPERAGKRASGVARGTASVRYHRLSVPGVWPGSWRVAVPDVPLALSPAGLCNDPVGAAGRPGEPPAQRRAWRWEEVREVGVAKGMLYVNGAVFCADTGHLAPRELLQIAQLPAARREARLRSVIGRWFRPAHLRRRAAVLAARTRGPAALNAFTLIAMALLTIYVGGDFSGRLPERGSAMFARALPWLLLALLASHVTATLWTWRAVRRLRPVTVEKRSANLFSALLLPPQALRLRALAGEGFFPVQHPLAAVFAFGKARARRARTFNVLADLAWPATVSAATAASDAATADLAREVTQWFGAVVREQAERALRATDPGLTREALLAPPGPDSPASCAYCPRCRDQFVAGGGACPHGVSLQPLGVRVR